MSDADLGDLDVELAELHLGSAGPRVELLRGWLHLAGHASCSRVGPVFDLGVHLAVRSFQTEAGLSATGAVNESTWGRLARVEIGRVSNLFRQLRGAACLDGSLAEMVVRAAIGAVGLREGSDDLKRILTDMLPGQPWAMAFVSWALAVGLGLYGLSGYGPLRTRQTSTIAAAVAATRANAILPGPVPGCLWLHRDGRAGVVLGVVESVLTCVCGDVDGMVQCVSVDATDTTGMSFIDVRGGSR